MDEAPSIKRRNHKWAMVGHKGGKCFVCGERVTAGNIGRFDFDHHVSISNSNDKSDRWGGGIRDWPPFTDKWFAWAKTVNLVCVRCHVSKHKNGNQLSLSELLSMQEVQRRLECFEHGREMTLQLGLFEE